MTTDNQAIKHKTTKKQKKKKKKLYKELSI